MGILILVGFVLLAGYAFDRHMRLAGLKEDLSAYLDMVRETVRITGDPHYKAIVFSLSAITSKGNNGKRTHAAAAFSGH